MSYVYQPDRGDYFESYLPQIGTSTHYDFYQAPTEPGEPLIPYGWRPDWSRATTGGWPTMATVPFTHATATQMTMSGMAQAAGQMAATQSHARITHPHLSQTLQLPINATAPSVQLASLTSTAATAAALPAPRFTAAPLTYRLPKPEVDPPKLSLPPTAPRSAAKSARKEAAKPFPCHICGKSFSQAANLTAHKRVHTGEKPFCCSVCQRPFSQSSSLVTHKRTHTGERPYPCPHCDKAFTDSSTLTKHLRTHTGLKPYACPMCLMRFTQSGNLHRHMKTHRASK